MAFLINDSQFDDKAGVLRNTFGLRDHAELERRIANYSAIRVLQLERNAIPGHFDIKHLRAIHHYIFQDVFPWAGDFREVMTSRTSSFGFPPPQFLIPSLETLFTNLRAEDHLKNLAPEPFILRAAHYLGELNAIHPFREGNGRTQREFIRTLALQAGHPLSWKNLTAEENNEASRISFAKGNNTALAEILRKCLL
ncbi:MAG: Fic family protein [Acidobacteriota bacterium]